jgi:mannose-6-phosphate isomerase-like protein (cupin superfamily)
MKRWSFAGRSLYIIPGVFVLGVAGFTGSAQSSTAASAVAWSNAQVQRQTGSVVAKAVKDPGGIATLTLSKSPGSYVMLSVRVKNGRAELHATNSDYIFVIDGEGTMMTGGTIVDAKPIGPNEIRGLKLEGASATPLQKGDTIHIPPGVPHQTMVAPGKKLVYFVVKAEKSAQ